MKSRLAVLAIFILGLATVSIIFYLSKRTDTLPEPVSSPLKPAETDEPIVGGDRDEHGCILSAGYSWCEEKQKCYRPWEEDCGEAAIGENRNILLYYYNPNNDIDNSGNIKCSRDGLVSIQREIPLTQTPIKDTISMLLEGKNNLIAEDRKNGIQTEFPLEGFIFQQANLGDDGTLTLSFDDPDGNSSGGSCRVAILWTQIEATARQFPGVKAVVFQPETLFQP